MKPYVKDCIFFILFGVISLIFIRDIIISQSIVSDAIWYLSLENYMKAEGHTPFLWNDSLSSRNLPILLSYHIPLIVIATVFNLNILQYAIIQLWFVYTLTGICMYILIKNILKNILKFETNNKILYISSFLGGLYYLAIPAYTLSYILLPDRIFYYAITPIIFLAFYKSIKLNKIRYAVLSALLISLYSYGYRFYVFVIILILSYFLFALFFELINNNKSYILKKYFRILFIFGTTIIAINGQFLLFSTANIQPSTTTSLTTKLIDIRFAYASLVNVIRGLGEITSPYFYSFKPPIISDFETFIVILSFIPPVLSALVLFSRRIRNVDIIYSLYFVNIFTIFALALPNFREWVILYSPLNDIFIGRAFSGLKAQFLIVFPFAVFFAISTYLIIEKLYYIKSKNIFIVLMSLFSIIVILMPSWPFLLGNLNNVYASTTIPDEYFVVNEWLKNQSGYFKSIWIPRGAYSHFYWSDSKFDISPIVDRGSSTPQYWKEATHPFFEYTTSINNSLLLNGETKALAELLSAIGVKYLVVHKDSIPSLIPLIDKQETYLKEDNDFKLVYKEGFISVFENRKFNDVIYITPYYFVSFGGLVMQNNIYNNLPSNLASFPIVISDYYANYNALLNAKSLVFTNEKNLYDIGILTTQKNVIIPTLHTAYYDAKGSKWSKAYIPDPHHGGWSPFINSIPNHRWESSYDLNYGFIFAAEKDNLKIPVNVEKDDRYYLFVRILKNPKGGEIKITLDNLSKTIYTKDNIKAEFVWVKVGEVYLSKGKHTLEIENIEGSNAVNILLLLQEKEYIKVIENTQKLLQNKTIIYVSEAESDFYRTNGKIIRYINASNNELIGFYKNGKAWQDVEIVKNGTYRVALKGIGIFNIKIGNHSFILKSNTLNFTYSPLLYLDKGKYRLEIVPLNVSNMVTNPSFEDISNGLPKGWSIGNARFNVSFDKGYDGKRSLKIFTDSTEPQTWSFIRSEPINIESGKEYLIISHVKYYNVKGVHIEISGFEEGKGWKRLTNVPSGREGNSSWEEYSAVVKVPENVTKLLITLNAGWVLDQSKGEAVTWFDDIQVLPLDKLPKLDVIWLYSTDTNQTIEELFEVKEKPAAIASYEKINPTLWKVKVNATKPFMLSFAESYDPLWEARVYKNDKLVENVKSIPLYSVINGFWINETGNLEIAIKYLPQDQFDLGLKISVTTFIASIGYIFIDWRRDKGDEWIKRLERRFKKAISSVVSKPQ